LTKVFFRNIYIFTWKQTKNHHTQVRNIPHYGVYTIVKLQNKNNSPDGQVENKTGKRSSENEIKNSVT